MLPRLWSGGGQSGEFLLPFSEINPLLLRATEPIGGASVPPSAPSSFPTSAGGTVQGAQLEAGPVLFRPCTLMGSSYECWESAGHEKGLFMTFQIVHKDSVESGTSRPKSLQFSLSLLLIHSFFKCEVALEQKNLEEEGKAKSLHEYLPCGKGIWTECLRGRHSSLLSLAHWFPTWFRVSKASDILFLNVNAAAC